MCCKHSHYRGIFIYSNHRSAQTSFIDAWGGGSNSIYTHSLATLLDTPCLYRVGPTFSFRTALILHGIDSTRYWKHSSEILVHIDMIASSSCCRFVGCTFMMWISRSTTSQRCSIWLRSGDCRGHLSKENSLSCSRNQSEAWNTLHDFWPDFPLILQSEQADASWGKSEPVCRLQLTDTTANLVVYCGRRLRFFRRISNMFDIFSRF